MARTEAEDKAVTEAADVVVVGAGPAGSTTAIGLARRGLRVQLLDRSHFPRDKACGEGILPHGVAALRSLGLYSRMLEAGAKPFRTLRYWAEDGQTAAAQFPPFQDLDEGLVLRRLQLDSILVEAARAEPNIEVLEEVRATGLLQGEIPGGGPGITGVQAVDTRSGRTLELRARLTVGADGLQSQVRRWLKADLPTAKPERFGLRGHLRGVQGLAGEVEVFLHGKGEIYMTQCGPNEALIALLLDRSAMGAFAGRDPNAFLQHLRGCAPLRHRLETAEPPQDLMAAGPLGTPARQITFDGALLVGDSAGALDPITAAGISLALRGGGLAAETASRALQQNDVRRLALQSYARQWTRERADLQKITRLVLRLCRHQRIASRVVRQLSRCPELLSRLLGVSVGAIPYRDITWREKLRLVWA